MARKHRRDVAKYILRCHFWEFLLFLLIKCPLLFEENIKVSSKLKTNKRTAKGGVSIYVNNNF